MTQFSQKSAIQILHTIATEQFFLQLSSFCVLRNNGGTQKCAHVRQFFFCCCCDMRKHPRKFIANVSFIIHRESSQKWLVERGLFNTPTPKTRFSNLSKAVFGIDRDTCFISLLLACSFGDGWWCNHKWKHAHPQAKQYYALVMKTRAKTYLFVWTRVCVCESVELCKQQQTPTFEM